MASVGDHTGRSRATTAIRVTKFSRLSVIECVTRNTVRPLTACGQRFVDQGFATRRRSPLRSGSSRIQDRGVAEDRPGGATAAAGRRELFPLLADLGVEALGEPLDEFSMTWARRAARSCYAGGWACRSGCSRGPCRRTGRCREDEADLPAENGGREVADRDVVDAGSSPRLRIVKPHEEIEEGRLAAAVAADDGDLFRLDQGGEAVAERFARLDHHEKRRTIN